MGSEPRRSRRLSLLVSAAVAAGGLATPAVASAGAAGSLDPGLTTRGHRLQRVVVSGTGVPLSELRGAVRAAGGRVGRDLGLIDGVSASVPADGLRRLARSHGVLAVTADRAAKLFSASFDQTVTSSMFAWTSGGVAAWGRGNKGAGVTVAVLDTGVSAVNDLAGRLTHGPDLSGENAPAVDSYGHGTVMGGLVAGSGADSAPNPRTGVAPSARVVSVKVAGANGVTDVSTVLAAMTWVGSYKDTYGIRVMNLSWGVPSTQNPAVDPLDYGVERLWRMGVAVVVAAGNSGPTGGTITKPGDDPLVLTVGAYDDHGNTYPGDDSVPQWSSQGPTATGLAKPDLVSPGRTVVATRSPGSTVETQNPNALVGSSYIKGSGTSEAAAVTSGSVALLLSAHPNWTPDQVKAALTSTANPIPGVPANVQGAGRIQVDSAMGFDASLVTAQPAVSSGLGTLEGSRGGMPRVSVTCNGVSEVLNTERTSWCTNWDSGSWTSGSWTSGSWTSGSWTSGSWTSGSWTGMAWTSGSWTSGSWTSGSWTSAGYDGTGTLLLSAFWGEHPKHNRSLPGERSEGPPSPGRGQDACDLSGTCS